MRIINLLPPSEQESIRWRTALRYMQRAAAVSVISYAVAFAALVGWRIAMQSSIRGLDSQIKQETDAMSKQDNALLHKQVETDNAIIKDYQTLAAANPQWSHVLVALSNLVPNGVQVLNLNANTDTGEIDISGKADTRDNVLLLRSNISNSPLFQKIDLPLENLQKPTDANYHYTFYLQDNVLVPKQ